MKNRREFMTAGGSLAVVPEVKAGQAQAVTLYIHGMVWNTKLPAPMNDWLIRLDAKVDAAIGNGPMPPHPGFATLGDDLHDPVGSHATINSAVLRDDQLVVLGAITESKTPSLVGQSFRLEGKVVGEEVQGLTVTIGGATFTGAGLLVKIAIIAILIAL